MLYRINKNYIFSVDDRDTSDHVGTFSIIMNIKNIMLGVNKRSNARNERKSAQGGARRRKKGREKKQERYSELTLQPEVAGQDW